MKARNHSRVASAVRNDREDRGNVGIIRSPVRASIPPDPIRTFCNVRVMLEA